MIFKETDRAVTPFGGLWVFFEHLKVTGFRKEAERNMPFTLTSPNAIRPVETLTCFLTSVLAGARRFSHTAVARADDALHAMMGVERFPGDDSFRNFFRRFNIGEVARFFHPMWEWMIKRLPDIGYSLDMDSTVFERYGKQEGSKKGFNPRKPGRVSHHPLLAVLAERRFVVIREKIREDKKAVGKKLIHVPGYTFRVFVTNMECETLEIWRDYNMRADVENKIEELKNDLAADSFCMKLIDFRTISLPVFCCQRGLSG